MSQRPTGIQILLWSGFALLATGLVLMAPSLPVIGGTDARRTSHLTWGVTLYLLGMLLASQVSAILG